MDNRLVIAYARLSQEELNRTNDYSESIYNQLNFIKSYAKSMNLKIDKEYVDDGCSGMNFDRLGFEELKNDIDKGLIDIVITKDISRLGRNFIETAYYISEYFSKHNVRYIAINDAFDSNNSSGKEQELMLNFKTLINDIYVKDVHLKTKQILKDKTSRGEFIGFIAPYGYKILRTKEKRTLKIDKEAANIIKRIFTEIASGNSRQEVADGLNNDKILSPFKYMKMTPSRNKKYYYDWTDKAIYRILRNQTYIGKIVERKSIKKNHMQKKREVIAIGDRKTIDNCHPAIISEKLFNEANNKLIQLRGKEKSNYYGILKDLVVCGECGKIMTVCRKKDHKTVQYYFNCSKIINRKPCLNRTITDSKLINIVTNNLLTIIKDYIDENKIVRKAINNLIKFERLNLKIANLKYDIELHTKNIETMYLKKTRGEITVEQFMERKDKEVIMKEEAQKLLKKILELKNENVRKAEILQKYRYFIEEHKFISIFLRDLVDKIIIYKDDTIKISFKFSLGNLRKNKLF